MANKRKIVKQIALNSAILSPLSLTALAFLSASSDIVTKNSYDQEATYHSANDKYQNDVRWTTKYFVNSNNIRSNLSSDSSLFKKDLRLFTSPNDKDYKEVNTGWDGKDTWWDDSDRKYFLAQIENGNNVNNLDQYQRRFSTMFYISKDLLFTNGISIQVSDPNGKQINDAISLIPQLTGSNNNVKNQMFNKQGQNLKWTRFNVFEPILFTKTFDKNTNDKYGTIVTFFYIPFYDRKHGYDSTKYKEETLKAILTNNYRSGTSPKWGIGHSYLNQNINSAWAPITPSKLNLAQNYKTTKDALSDNLGAILYIETLSWSGRAPYLSVRYGLERNTYFNKNGSFDDYKSAGESFMGIGVTRGNHGGSTSAHVGLISHNFKKEITKIDLVTTERFKEETIQWLRENNIDSSKVLMPKSDLFIYENVDKLNKPIKITDINKSKQTIKDVNSTFKTKTTLYVPANKKFSDYKLNISSTSSKDWVYSANNGNGFKFNKASTTGLGNNAGQIDIVWDLSDYAKLNLLLENSKWLTAIQKETIKNEYTKDFTSDLINLKSNPSKNFSAWTKYINDYNEAQKKYKESYFNLYKKVLSDSSFSSAEPELNFISDKINFLFSNDQANKRKVISALTQNLKYAAFFSSEFNNNLSLFVDRKNVRDKNSLKSLDEIQRLTNQLNELNKITFSGYNYIKVEFDKLKTYEIISLKKNNQYNYKQALNFIKEAIKNASDFAKTSLLKTNNYNDEDTETFFTNFLTDKTNDFKEIINSIKDKNDFYKRLVNFQNNIQTLLNSSYYKDGLDSTYGGKTYADIFNQTFNSFQEEVKEFTGEFKNTSFNVFSSLSNLNAKSTSLTFSNTDSVSEHALTFKYQNLAKKLLKELSNVFGNGVKLAKEINQYQGLTQEQKNNLLTNTNNTTNSIVSNESFTINGKKVSIDNFTLDSNVAFRIIDNTSKVNSALLQFSNLVYLMSAKYYQAEINKLSNLSRSLKQKYSSLIAALINKNDIKIYKNDSDIKDVYEKAKILDNEQKRLNDLITTYESLTSNSPYYFDYIGKNIDVNNASLSNVVSSTDANLDVRINRLAIVETHKDTNSYSYIKVNYTLNSTKNLTYKNETINEILTSKVATSKEIGPFIYIRDTEIKKLEDLSTNIVLTYDGDKSKITPDKVDSKKIVFKYKESNGSLVDLTSKGVKVENVNFISNIIPDDLEKGNLYVSYTLVSTVDLNAKKVINANSLRNTYVSEKNHLNSIAISGFLKEKDRLNNILLDYSIIKNIQNIDNKNNLLASSIKANSIKFLALSPLSLEAKIDANSIQLSANDNNGTLTITYKLLSTKERLEKISSSKTNSIVIDGFLSILKQKQNEAIKMLETYSNINQVVKDYYKQQINNALDEVQISNILLEAYKQNISNNIRNVYQYLNTKQVSNLVDLINSQTSKEKVDEIFKAYKDNDDKMRQLKEKVNYYKNLLNNSSNEINYFYASNELKNNFNSTLNDASNLLISDVNDGTNSPNLTILLSNSHNSLDSLFNHLDGNKNFYSNQINEYNFLSQSEKNNFISELKAVDLDLGETKSLELIKNIVKKAKETNDYKENLFNNFETNYRNLNSAQISKYKNLIPLTNKSNLDQEIISKVSTYNANMAILKAKIAQIEKDVIKSDKYKFANNNRELDNILSIARELVASYVNVGEENPSLADLIGSKNLPNSLDNKYYSLDGNKVAALSKIQLYWFLSDAEKSTYSFYISTINLLSDQADENILNKFKEAEKTNQDKEQFFNGLPTKYSYLNNSQIYQYQDQIRNYNLSELENTIGSNAKELNEQMKALNDEILSELKALTKNNNIKDITSQEDKTLEKYVFANKEAKNSYNLSLEEAINLFNKFSGKNASLTEVKNLLANLKSNYSRLDGQNSIEKAKEIVNNLLNLSLKQKENVNKLIDSKNKDLAKANTVVSLADTIDKNLMQLEDKFKAIEKIKNQVIYSMDSTINKTNLDNNITKFQKLLSDVKANNFDNSNEDKLRKIRNDLYEAIKTLDSNLANLSGNKIALKNDLAKFSLLTNDKLDQLKNKVDNFSAEISEKQKNDILSEALESSKATALAQLETELYSAYLSKDEKTTFRDQIIKAQLTPNLSKYDNDIAVLLAQANDKNNQKAQTILEIKNLSNINDNQSEFFKNSIINSSTKNLKTYLDEAKLIDREMKEIKNITLDQLTQLTRKNITNFDSKIELIDGNYKFALENTKKAYDQVLNNVITLLNKAKGANLNLEALTNLKTELNTKFSALNGNDIVQANNLIIDFFVVINQNQKEQIKANISKLDNRNANNVINNLQEVDKLLISALNTINKASNAKKNNLYLKDNTVKKTTLDEALNALNSLVTNIKNTDFTSTKLEEILLLEDKINRANSNLLEAFNNLDGYRNSLISELNKYILISNDDKKLFLNEINNLPKALSDDLANSFWNKINNYVNSVALTNLSSNKLLNFNEINTFVNKINAIKIINDNISIPDQQYQDILNEASELNLQKNSYLKKLTNFSYLNNKQIEFLTNEIKNTNLNDLNNVVNLANDLNLLMQKLNDLVLNQLSELTNQTISDNQNNSPRITNNYKLSDLSLRNNYDDLLAYIQSVLVKNSLINASKDELNSLYENLTLKYKNLNGNDNLASLINKLEAISNFSKTQKEFSNC
ncbi:hypothetical protein ACLRE7_00840 [Mycoplasmopsis meleagridis]